MPDLRAEFELPCFMQAREQGSICQPVHALSAYLQSAFLQTRGLLLRLIHSAELWAGMHMLRGICSWGARPAYIASGAAPGQARRLACYKLQQSLVSII